MGWKKDISILLLAFTLCMFLFTPPDVYAQGEIAELGIVNPLQVAPGELVQVPIIVRNVQDLYGVDFTLEFDSSVVQVEDSDPASPGIQSALGDFLDPGLLLTNSADNQAGNFQFVMSQYNPSEPKTGEGIIVVITFKGISEGDSTLNISFVQLASREGVEIPSDGLNSLITVETGAPTQEATYPVQEPTGLVVVDLSTFTPTPTNTLIPTATVVLQSTPNPVTLESPADEGKNQVSENQEDIPDYWLVKNWWIVVVLILLVIGTGYLLRINQKKQEGGN